MSINSYKITNKEKQIWPYQLIWKTTFIFPEDRLSLLLAFFPVYTTQMRLAVQNTKQINNPKYLLRKRKKLQGPKGPGDWRFCLVGSSCHFYSTFSGSLIWSGWAVEDNSSYTHLQLAREICMHRTFVIFLNGPRRILFSLFHSFFQAYITI